MGKVKFRVPSGGTVLGFLALIISLGSAAYAAGTLVTIGDPITTQKARVAAPGRLGVYIDTPVTTRTASPATSVHIYQGFDITSGCSTVTAPPAGKALVIRQVNVNIFKNPTPGQGQQLFLFTASNCTTGSRIYSLTPPTLGHNAITFDPGLHIPQGQVLAIEVAGSIGADLGVDGYYLPAAAVTSGIAEAPAN